MSEYRSRGARTNKRSAFLCANDMIEGVGKGVVAMPGEKENVAADCSVSSAKEPKRYRKNTTWHVHCPVCGAYLEKILDRSSSMVDCRRCHAHLGVVVDNGTVLVFEVDEPDSDEAVARLSRYKETLQRLSRGELKEKYRIVTVYDTPITT